MANIAFIVTEVPFAGTWGWKWNEMSYYMIFWKENSVVSQRDSKLHSGIQNGIFHRSMGFISNLWKAHRKINLKRKKGPFLKKKTWKVIGSLTFKADESKFFNASRAGWKRFPVRARDNTHASLRFAEPIALQCVKLNSSQSRLGVQKSL